MWLDEAHTLKKHTMSTIQSLSHSKYDCKYHIVFIPKRRRKVIFMNRRKEIVKIFYELARQKESKITEGSISIDHVHMCIEIPPKHKVALVIGFLKGKSAIAVSRMNGKERNYKWSTFLGKRVCGLDSRI